MGVVLEELKLSRWYISTDTLVGYHAGMSVSQRYQLEKWTWNPAKDLVMTRDTADFCVAQEWVNTRHRPR